MLLISPDSFSEVLRLGWGRSLRLVAQRTVGMAATLATCKPLFSAKATGWWCVSLKLVLPEEEALFSLSLLPSHACEAVPGTLGTGECWEVFNDLQWRDESPSHDHIHTHTPLSLSPLPPLLDGGLIVWPRLPSNLGSSFHLFSASWVAGTAGKDHILSYVISFLYRA